MVQPRETQPEGGGFAGSRSGELFAHTKEKKMAKLVRDKEAATRVGDFSVRVHRTVVGEEKIAAPAIQTKAQISQGSITEKIF